MCLNVFFFSVLANPCTCCVCFGFFFKNGFKYLVCIILHKMEDIFVLCSHLNPGPEQLFGEEKRHNSPIPY